MPISAIDRKLLDRLVQKHLLEPNQIEAIVRKAERQNAPVARVLWQSGFLDEKTITRHVARLNGVDFLDLDSFEIDPAVLKHLRPSQARRYRAVPAGLVDGMLVFAVADLSNILLMDELRALANGPSQLVLATESALDRTIDKAYFGSGPRPSGDSNLLPAAISLSGIDTFSGEEDELLDEVPLLEPPNREMPPTVAESASEPNVLTQEFLHTSAVTRVVPVSSLTTQIEYDSSEISHGSGDSAMHQAALSAVAVATELEQAGEEKTIDPDELRELLRRIIDHALAARAEELEFNPPSSRPSRVRQRRDGAWSDGIEYEQRHHEPLISALRALARVSREKEGPVESHFSMEGTRGRIPVVACFMPTYRGNRCVLRFPENVPLIQKPLRVLGIGDSIGREYEKRLYDGGGGVLLLSANQSRLLQQVYASILFDQVARKRSVTSIQINFDRRIPRVNQINCPDDTVLDRVLSHVAVEEPDLCGLSLIPGGETLKRLFTMALNGRTFVGCLNLPGAGYLLSALKSAGVDPMATALGLIAHLHVSRVPRLCTQCRRPISDTADLPAWAANIDPSFLREAPGCHACGNTGRKGMSWVCEAWMPDIGGDGRLLPVQGEIDVLERLAMEGNLDPRDVPC